MNTQETLQQLDALYAKGNREEIERFMRNCIFQAEMEHDWGTQVMIQNELVGLCRTQSRYEEGAGIFEDTRQLLSLMGLAGTVPYAGTLINGATLFRAAGWLERADQIYAEAKDIYESQLSSDDFRLAGFYNNYSLLKMEQHLPMEAKDYMEKALSIIEQLPDTTSEQAINHTNIANLCMDLKDLDGAKSHLDMAARLFQLLEGKDPHEAACLSAQGQLYAVRGENEEAKGSYLQALDILERSYGKNRSYRMVCRSLSIVLRRLGEDELASAYEQEAEEKQ